MRSVPVQIALPLMLALVACGDKDDTDGGGDDGGVGDGGTDDGTGGDTDAGVDSGTSTDGDGGTDSAEPDPIEADVNGLVVVKFVQDDGEGNLVEVALEDTPWADGVWPFGSIFVAAAQSDGEDDVFYRGDTVIREPSFAGDAYNLDVTLPEAGLVQLVANLDLRGDGIIDSWDPKGVHGNAVALEDGDEVDDKQITITIDYDAALSWWTGGGGGGCPDTVNLSGTAELSSPWASGDVAVLLYGVDGTGPYHVTRGEPTPDGGGTGASMPYVLASCAGYGEMQLRGAWDSNLNGLIDPADLWGTWVEDGEEANPLNVGTADVDDLTIEIPYGDGRAGLGISPFVPLAGSIRIDAESFDALEPGSVIYMSALLFKPTGEFSVLSLGDASYGYLAYEESDWTGKSSLEYSLWVPSNTTVYVWANVDSGPKPDGTLNQPSDWIGAAGGEYTGWFPTGTSGDDDVTVTLTRFTPDP